uniref:Zinc finger, CCHC-type n=1 Tax=Tanacetum cinerariifolium TaxID=118510 RepID=A0A6L2M498_TANCI|nr:zinc finger, CCHC-type [Tanacetum cinerariifolium]
MTPHQPPLNGWTNRDKALGEQDELLLQLKQNLLAAKNRMEMKANRHHREVEFNPRPYEMLERIRKVAYRLALSKTSKIHVVVHVLILKAFLGNGIEEVSNLPEELYEGHPVEQPLLIFGTQIDLTKEFLSSRFSMKDMGEADVIFGILALGGAISWASKKQTYITNSTMESEFVALSTASKEVEWLKNLSLKIPLWSKPIAPISICYDNVATLTKDYK